MVEDLPVALEQSVCSWGEVVVGTDSFDLGGERVDDELVDAVASDSGDSLGVVGEVVGQAHGRLLCHDLMISRLQLTNC